MLALIAVLSMTLCLGIVGTVERGGSVALLLLLIPIGAAWYVSLALAYAGSRRTRRRNKTKEAYHGLETWRTICVDE